jgi:hypothetical protein
VEQPGKLGNEDSPASQATDNCRPDDNHRSEGTQGGNSGKSGQTHINSRSVKASGAVERLRGKNIKAPAYTTCHAEAARRRMVTFTRIPYAEAARRARRQDRIFYASLIAIAILIATL